MNFLSLRNGLIILTFMGGGLLAAWLGLEHVTLLGGGEDMDDRSPPFLGEPGVHENELQVASEVQAGEVSGLNQGDGTFEEDALNEAKILVQARSYRNAETSLRALLGQDIDAHVRAEANVMLGHLLVGQGYLEDALELFREAVDSGALMGKALFDASLDVLRTLAKLGQFSEVEMWLKDMQNVFLNKANLEFTVDEATLMIARTLRNIGLADLAVTYADKISGSDSKSAREAALLASKCYISLNRLDEARSALLGGIGDDGGSPVDEVSKMYYELAKLAKRQGFDDEAIAWIAKGREAFMGSEGYDDYLFYLGSWMRKKGIPGWRDMLTELAVIDESKYRESALEQLAAAAKREGHWDDAELFNQQLFALADRDASKQAVDYLQLIKARRNQDKPIDDLIHGLMAYLDADEATDYQAVHTTGKTLLECGYLEEAARFFKHASETAPDSILSGNSLLLYGDALAASGDTLGANQAYQNHVDAMKLSGEHDLAAQTLYRMIEKTGGINSDDQRQALITRIQEETQGITDPAKAMALFDYFAARNERVLYEGLLDQAIVLNNALPTPNWSVQKKILQNLFAYARKDDAMALADAILYPGSTSPQAPEPIRWYSRFIKARLKLASGDVDGYIQDGNAVLAASSGDSAAYADYAASMGENLYFEGRVLDSMSYFERALAQPGSSKEVARAHIYLGAEAFKKGEYSVALQHSDAVLQSTSPSDKIRLQRDIYWGGVYIQQKVWLRQGKQADSGLLEKSINSAKWLPLRGI